MSTAELRPAEIIAIHGEEVTFRENISIKLKLQSLLEQANPNFSDVLVTNVTVDEVGDYHFYFQSSYFQDAPVPLQYPVFGKAILWTEEDYLTYDEFKIESDEQNHCRTAIIREAVALWLWQRIALEPSERLIDWNILDTIDQSTAAHNALQIRVEIRRQHYDKTSTEIIDLVLSLASYRVYAHKQIKDIDYTESSDGRIRQNDEQLRQHLLQVMGHFQTAKIPDALLNGDVDVVEYAKRLFGLKNWVFNLLVTKMGQNVTRITHLNIEYLNPQLTMARLIITAGNEEREIFLQSNGREDQYQIVKR